MTAAFTDRACALVFRGRRVLAFRHPLAGLQLVKGRLEPGERPAHAALRELREESGIRGRQARLIGKRRDLVPGQTWYLFRIAARTRAARWTHHAPDDGGHAFRFFWHPLAARAPRGFARPYLKVLRALARPRP